MRTLQRRIQAILCALAMVLSLGIGVSAEETIYYINGYNKDNNIRTADGTLVRGHSFCLDFKEGQPLPDTQKYTRTTLSQLGSYEKSHDLINGSRTRSLSDEAKLRLLRIAIHLPEINDMIQQRFDSGAYDEHFEYVLEHAEELDLNSTYALILKEYKNGEITEEQYRTKFLTRLEIDFGYSNTQQILWALVWDDADWAAYTADKNNYDTGNKADNYYTMENMRYYHSDDPINDPHSLWNIFYVPMIEYVDSFTETFEDGYDVWVYVTEDREHQNIMGTYFRKYFSFEKHITDSDIPVPGAAFKITDSNDKAVTLSDADGNTFTEFETEEEPVRISTASFEAGKEYRLTEIEAPEGFTVPAELADGVVFRVNEYGDVILSLDYEQAKSEDGTFTVYDDKIYSVSITKTDITTGAELEGAELQLLNGDGEIIDEWKSSLETHVIEGLVPDTEYTLREVTAPLGYTVTADTVFTISIDGTVTANGTEVPDGIILIEDDPIRVSVSKVDIADGREIEGAHIRLMEGDAVIEEWDSTTAPHTINSILRPGAVYVLRETAAPDGYTIASDTEFTVDSTGRVTTSSTVTEDGIILIEDAPIRVSVSKVDIADGREIEGAHIQLIDGEDVIEEWDSTTVPHVITALLKPDHEYILRETVAPDGYTIASDTTFTVDSTGRVITSSTVTEDGVILIEDTAVKVSVSKVDIADGREIEGAHIQLIDGDTVIEEWDSTTVSHVITTLLKPDHEYILRETVAPDGYTVASDTTFTVDSTGRVITSSTVTEDGIILIEDEMIAENNDTELDSDSNTQSTDGNTDTVKINGQDSTVNYPSYTPVTYEDVKAPSLVSPVGGKNDTRTSTENGPVEDVAAGAGMMAVPDTARHSSAAVIMAAAGAIALMTKKRK